MDNTTSRPAGSADPETVVDLTDLGNVVELTQGGDAEGNEDKRKEYA